MTVRASVVLRYVLTTFLLATSLAAAAGPIIADDLRTRVPRIELDRLLTLAEQKFHLPPSSVRLLGDDDAPVGQSAAVVDFPSKPLNDEVWEFRSAYFYFLPWSKEPDARPLDDSRQRLLSGNWASDGELHRQQKYRIPLSSGANFVGFRKGVPYKDVLSLMMAIQNGAYDVKIEDSPDAEARAVTAKNLAAIKNLKPESVYAVSEGELFDFGPRHPDPLITAFSVDERGMQSFWMFAIRKGRYVLILYSKFVH